MNYDQMQDEISDLNDKFLKETMRYKGIRLGLDIRAAYQLYCCPEFIAVEKQYRGTLEYFGGFEYVDKEHVLTVGDIVYYFATDPRVRTHLIAANILAEDSGGEEE